MKSETYLLSEIIEVHGEMELLCRFLEVERSDDVFRVVSSESDYLGSEPIEAELFEEDGEPCFRFDCPVEAGGRTFRAEVQDQDWDYIHGDVSEHGGETGQFVLRRVPS